MGYRNTVECLDQENDHGSTCGKGTLAGILKRKR
jgi:hypothetical protein